ncbi:acyl-CoA dehydrogenase family protein [Pseudonocardia bannensis]|uniref:Acyl-CoA/acyl-ACP dehydrogenase n=1 Tax=Pseudonocardia bannensis TaxID=630973 RepID=A0A848DPE0_9PSEU|nr:acyl-CoA dehydrogenase family protein [Pseudonocardia bannensis]NMH94687.1 acyl-CoA/acyl-ACP dehydrogenase [Pseudonocardia bannensis]
MDFTFSAEQIELGAVVRSFLDDHAPESEVRRLMADERGWDPAIWARLATEIGLQGLAVPELYGGAGFGPLELGVAFEEMGRALLCAPFLSSIGLAATALLASGDEGACKEYLPAIAAGETVATLALNEDSGSWTEPAVTTRADRGAGGWRLSGDKTYVLDGHTAGLLLVVARSRAGTGVFAVDVCAAAPGVTRTALPTLDQTRKQARIELRDAPARLIGEDGAGWAAVEQALRVGAVLLAAEQVGGASRVLDMAVRYAKDRHQFGRPIGSFQAIKHKCADMVLQLEAARSAAYHALWAAASDVSGGSGTAELPVAASLAKVYCSEAYTFCAGENVQIHGGIGFTWEHPAHLYLKRAKSSETLLGSPAFHRERLATLVGI